VNDRIRAVALARLEEKGLTYVDLARVTGTTSQAITRAFEETGSRGGLMSQLWADILEALSLELTAQPRTPGEQER